MRYLITMSYDGTRYSGWQKQENSAKTISAKIENVLSVLNGGPVSVQGAGRTDAGVHALAQTATFDLKGSPDPAVILRAFREYLPEDISVHSCNPVDSRFHARLSALGKIYRYEIRTSPCADVFRRKYQWHLGKTPDAKAMKAGARFLEGTHDFTSFSTKAKSRHGNIRTVSRISLTEKDGTLSLEFEGDGFLYNMVRIMTGTLIEIGLGKRKPDEIPAILAARDRSAAGFTAPAQGLTLVKVLYPESAGGSRPDQ